VNDKKGKPAELCYQKTGGKWKTWGDGLTTMEKLWVTETPGMGLLFTGEK